MRLIRSVLVSDCGHARVRLCHHEGGRAVRHPNPHRPHSRWVVGQHTQLLTEPTQHHFGRLLIDVLLPYALGCGDEAKHADNDTASLCKQRAGLPGSVAAALGDVQVGSGSAEVRQMSKAGVGLECSAVDLHRVQAMQQTLLTSIYTLQHSHVHRSSAVVMQHAPAPVHGCESVPASL